MMEKQMKHTMLAVQAFLNEEAGVIRHEALAEALEKEGFVPAASGAVLRARLLRSGAIAS